MDKPMLNAIVIHDIRYGIAKDGKQMVYFKEDLERFRSLTTGKTVIMGRTTADIIGKPLPNRRNVVITHDVERFIQNHPKWECDVYDSLHDHLDNGDIPSDSFVVGGGLIYRLAFDRISTIYGTMVLYDFGCDTFLPTDLINPADWRIPYHTRPTVGVAKNGKLYRLYYYNAMRW